MRPRLRPPLFLATLAAAAAGLLTARTAAAQFDAGTTSFGAEDFFIGVQHQPGANLSDFEVARFFNKANCDCDVEVFVYVALTNSGFAKRTLVDRTGNIEFWVGSNCGSNDGLRNQRCTLLGAPTLAAFLNDGRAMLPTNARVMSTYTLSTGFDGGVPTDFTPNSTCTAPVESFDQTIFVVDYSSQGQAQTLSSRQVHIDLTPPPAPDPLFTEVRGGEQAVVISWQGVDSAVVTDLLGYQVLCNRGGELQVFSDGTFKPGYESGALLCPEKMTGAGGVLGLDPRFICSPLLSATAREFRVKILQNDITYGAAVVAIDISGNASVPDIFYGTAIKTKSFYDVYRDDQPHPGTAGGGFCTLAERGTSRGAVAGLCAALIIGAIVLVRRRRRR